MKKKAMFLSERKETKNDCLFSRDVSGEMEA